MHLKKKRRASVLNNFVHPLSIDERSPATSFHDDERDRDHRSEQQQQQRLQSAIESMVLKTDRRVAFVSFHDETREDRFVHSERRLLQLRDSRRDPQRATDDSERRDRLHQAEDTGSSESLVRQQCKLHRSVVKWQRNTPVRGTHKGRLAGSDQGEGSTGDDEEREIRSVRGRFVRHLHAGWRSVLLFRDSVDHGGGRNRERDEGVARATLRGVQEAVERRRESNERDCGLFANLVGHYRQLLHRRDFQSCSCFSCSRVRSAGRDHDMDHRVCQRAERREEDWRFQGNWRNRGTSSADSEVSELFLIFSYLFHVLFST